jgi:hypothetical protein
MSFLPADSTIVQTRQKHSKSIHSYRDRVLARPGDARLGLHILYRSKVTFYASSLGSEYAVFFRPTAGSPLGLPSYVRSEPHTPANHARTTKQRYP